MISVSTKSSDSLSKKLQKLAGGDLYSSLSKYGAQGVAALAAATPTDSGLTASSWEYRLIKSKKFPGIEWYNTSDGGDVSVAILIRYGHGTGTGGWVPGRDFISPVMKPIFDQIEADVWKKVTG